MNLKNISDKALLENLSSLAQKERDLTLQFFTICAKSKGAPFLQSFRIPVSLNMP